MFDMLTFLSADDPVKRRVHYTVVLKKVGHIHHEQSNLKETYLYVNFLSSY